MQLGTYTPDGRPLSYEESTGRFDLGGMAVTLKAIVSWDALNEIAWDRPDVRTWVLTLPRTPVVAPAPQSVTKKSNIVGIVAALAALMMLCFCGAVIANMLAASTPGSSGSSTPGAIPAAPTLALGQQQAVQKAQRYLETGGFSRKALIRQLVFEKFSEADAQFAVDKVAPDWNAQAAKKARIYLEMGGFSRLSLIEQLVFEGFTQAEAEYGAKAVGY